MTEDTKRGCGCLVVGVLIYGVIVLIDARCPIWVYLLSIAPLLLAVGACVIFEKLTPENWSKKRIEEACAEQTRGRSEKKRGKQVQNALQERSEKQRVAEEREIAGRKRRESAERKRQFENARDEQNRRRLAAAEAEKNRREERFMRYLFSMLAKLSKAGGGVDAAEVKMVEKVFERFDFASRRRKFCDKVFNEAKDNSRSIYWYAEQLGNQVEDTAVCNVVYEFLWDVACADGWLHPAEKEILQNICKHLRIPEAYYHINYRRRLETFKEGDKNEKTRHEQEKTEKQPKRPRNCRKPYVSGRSSILDAYELLECEQTATNVELKASYRRLAKRYHPDMLRNNGVPEEMIAEATETMSQVNAAWEDICRARGI